MKLKDFWRKNRAFLLFVVVLMALRWSWADQYHVPSGSMEPTVMTGDNVFVSKAAYDLRLPFTEWRVVRLNDPQPGDVIVFDSPENGITLLKRIVGGPGDELDIVDGKITRNGVPEGDYGKGAERQWIPELHRSEHLHFVIPQDHYFAMGDNRDNSHDSRAWGFVPRNLIKGKAKIVLANVSLESLQTFKTFSRTGMEL